MILEAFAIFDSKTGAYSAPFFSHNSAVAQRVVASSIREGTSLLARFPEDYTLYRVGTFDDATSELVGCAPSAVCNLISLREVVHAS